MEDIKRKIQEIAGSLLVSLPREWARQMGLHKGSSVSLNVGVNGELKVSPVGESKKIIRSEIRYSVGAESKLLASFLSGSDTIIISFADKEPKGARTRLSSFARRNLMGVELVASGKRTITFKVHESGTLGIEELFRRMFIITLSMYEDVQKCEASEVAEKDLQVTRYYHLLIRSVRKFLSEGGFAGKELGLLRGVDFRMAAEKVERVGDALKRISEMGCVSARSESKRIQESSNLYKQSVFAFLKSDIEKAIVSRDQALKIIKRFKSGYKHGKCGVLGELQDIATHSSEIANLCPAPK